MKKLIFLCCLFVFRGLTPVSAMEPDATTLAESFLEAMGGREVWARAEWVHNWAVNHHPQARIIYTQEAWISLDEPRQYIKLRNFDMNRDRALDGNRAWRLSEGKFSAQSPDEVKEWQAGLSKSIYWKLSKLARKDPRLNLAIGKEGRLEFREDGHFLGWLRLNEDGSPVMHGAEESGGASTTFGDLVEFGPIKWVRSGEETSGWGFEILSIRLGQGVFPVSTIAPEP